MKVEGEIKNVASAMQQWDEENGIPMLDYSSQQKDARLGKHTEHLDPEHFKIFIDIMCNQEFDLMFEIKDKERSVLEAQTIIPD